MMSLSGNGRPERERARPARVALVTGASRGIGRAVAERLAADRALIIVHYRHNEADAAVVAAGITAAGGEAFIAQGDVADLGQIERMFAAIDTELQRRRGSTAIDIVVNNAAALDGATIERTEGALFDRLFAVNTRGVFFVTKHALSRIPNGGRLVFISSLASYVPFPEFVAYAMTKGGVNTLAVTLAASLRSRAITVNAVVPGPVWTAGPRHPDTAGRGATATLIRPALPADVAGVVAMLVSPDGGWITGQCVEATGGFRG